MAHEDILKLKRSYDKSTWLKKFFFPRKLRAALEQYDLNANADSEALQAIIICRIIKDTWSIQRWFFSLFFDNSLEDFFKSDFVGAVNVLDSQDLLEGGAGLKIFQVVQSSNNIWEKVDILVCLHNKNLLSDAYRDVVFRYNERKYPVLLFNMDNTILALLQGDQEQGLYCLEAILSSRSNNPFYFSGCLTKLKEAGTLTKANCQKIGNLFPSKLEPLYKAIDKLEKAELFTPERAQINLNALLGAAYPLPAADSLIELHTVDLWTADNCLFLEHGERPASTVKCLINLKEVGLLTVNGNCQKLANKTAPMVDLNLAFRKLREANLLDQQNFDAVVGNKEPLMVANWLVHLSPELLTHENRCRVAAYQGNYFSLASGYEMLKTLPERLDSFVNKRVLWTQANFDVLFGGNDPAGAAGSLFTLHKAGLLGDDEAGQRRRAVVAKHIQGFDNMLHSLYDSEILTTENFDLVAASENPRQTVRVLLELAKKTTVDRTVTRHKTAVVDDGAAAVPNTGSVNPAKDGIFNRERLLLKFDNCSAPPQLRK